MWEVRFRRAIERKAKKLESKRLLANQANAQLSTGPTSEEGKAKSCLNAVKTALTGCTVLLPSDDTAEYQRHLDAFEQEFQPVGLRECELVQSIADTWWRLRRVPALEMALFAKGRIEFADLFEEQELAARPLLIDSLSSELPTKHALNHHFYASVVFRIALRAIDIILDLAKHKLKPVAGKETK